MLSDHRLPETLPCWRGIYGGKVVLEQVFLSFSRSVKFHPCSIVIFIYTILYHKEKLVKLGNLKSKQRCFENRGALYPSVAQQPIWSIDRVMADTIRPTDFAGLLWTNDQLVAETATYTTQSLVLQPTQEMDTHAINGIQISYPSNGGPHNLALDRMTARIAITLLHWRNQTLLLKMEHYATSYLLVVFVTVRTKA
jgi:hypothetical protein